MEINYEDGRSGSMEPPDFDLNRFPGEIGTS